MDFVAPWFHLGYVIPHLYTDMDAYQFYRIAPEGMMLVTTQLNLKSYDPESVEAELPTLWERIDLLTKKQVDRIAISGVPLAAMLGRQRTLDLLAEASRRTGLPCDTDFEAHVAALAHLGVKKVAFGSRWPEALNQAVVRYLAEVGVEVVALRAAGRSLEQNKAARAIDDHQLALDLGRQLLTEAPEAEALILPGGLWFAIYAAPMLEAAFGKPVLLNITATTWAALASVRDRIEQYPDKRWGRLLAGLGTPAVG